MYFARACVRAHAHMCKRERQRWTLNRYKKTAKTRKKSCPEFFCTKAKNRENDRKRRKRNHQSTIKFAIFTGGMTNNDLKNSHRRHIFARNSRHFLCFPFGKRRFPSWKTYVSRQENIRLPWRKHRQLKGNGELSHRHFFNTTRLKREKRSAWKTNGKLTGKNKQLLTGKTKETAWSKPHGKTNK